MVCRVEQRIGVILFEDFVSSSRKLWKTISPHATPKVERMSVSPVFVFKSNDYKSLDILLKGCCVWEGTFLVDYGPYDELAKAYKHIHKKDFDF